MKTWILAITIIGCADKAENSSETQDTSTATGTDTDTNQTTIDETTPEEIVSTYEAGTYQITDFALSEDSDIGLDIDGDGEIDNKLVSVLAAAALFTDIGQAADINKILSEQIAKGDIVMLSEMVHDTGDLTLDLLLGDIDKDGNLFVDDNSYDENGDPNSRLSGAFVDQTNFAATSQYIEVPFPIMPDEPPVLIPLSMVTAEGSADDKGSDAIIGGAVPVEAFVNDIIDDLIPTGEEYDPALYNDMERDEFMKWIWDFASSPGVADITLADGSPAVSAAVTFTATATAW